MMKPYIAGVVDGDPGVFIYGPFQNDEVAVEFGRKWQADNGDELRWNLFHTSYDSTVIPIRKPY